MHDSSFRSLDFSIPLPPLNTPQITTTYNHVASAQIVPQIIKNVDSFYKPRVSCRRKFTLDGVEKYFPEMETKLNKRSSFLHRSIDNKVFKVDNTVRKICFNFLVNERVAICNENAPSSGTFYLFDVSDGNIKFSDKKCTINVRTSSCSSMSSFSSLVSVFLFCGNCMCLLLIKSN